MSKLTFKEQWNWIWYGLEGFLFPALLVTNNPTPVISVLAVILALVTGINVGWDLYEGKNGK